MTKVTFHEPATTEWQDWKNRCISAIRGLIDDYSNGTQLEINNLYKEQKAIYFDTHSNFHGKCAYCESLIASNQPGDVEHFRPKGRITDANNRPVMIDDGAGNKIPHPGYYWLAYRFENLLPSCIDCNRPSKGNSTGILIGKWDQFPVRGDNALNPGDEIDEEPLLIHPIDEDPENHLEVDNIGVLHSKDDRGEKCIEIFGLNLREALVNERKNIYDDVKDKAKLLIIARANGAPTERYENEILAYKAGVKPYSIAGRKAIMDISNELRDIAVI
jgi:hypothetical protein